MDARAEPGRADADRGGDDQLADGDVLALGHLGFDLLELGMHAVRRAEELFADFGEDKAARVANEELEVEIFFEGRNLPRYGRLAHVQLFGGVGEAPRFRGGVEDPELVPIEHDYSAASARFSSAKKRSASSAAMQPIPAAVTAWRKTSSVTSPAAYTPGIR